ncbi:signal recognition particle, SRP9/SRP14 subunit [Entophlyctis helioformis]|nr:signal recognition particle, SRP9/SRP14 subunit [Entophlyctis helioformis]
MGLLTNDQFLARLADLYDQTQTKGTVYITMKRYAYPLERAAKKDATAKEALASPTTLYPSIIRAVAGNRKISSVVEADQLLAFTDAFTAVARSRMTALKRKDRKASKKAAKKGSGNEAAV